MRPRIGVILALLGTAACSAQVHGVTFDGGALCGPCVATIDCPGNSVCAALPGAICASPCLSSSDCSQGQVCTSGSTVEGAPTKICLAPAGDCSGQTSSLPDGGSTGPSPDGGTTPTPDAGPTGYCDGLAGPNVSGTCCTCARHEICSENNCYNGYLCDPTSCTCVAPPSDCSSTNTPDAGMTTPMPDAGTTPSGDAGFTSAITASGGGTESQLYFAVIGDTRPANGCDTSTNAYPTAIITKIYQDLQNLSPRPPFVITTGDYQYVDQGGGSDPSCPSLAATQFGYYTTARRNYSGVLWPAMGNHECDGYADSDCGSGCPSGDPGCAGSSNTSNFLEFQSQMLAPIGETLPYYTRTVSAPDGSWKATFIITAPNYWRGTQQSSWVTQQISAAGTHSSSNYVFVIHHEDATASSPPAGLAPIESAEADVETLSIVGHSHFWQWGTGGPYHETNARQLLVGNGGAPLTSETNSSTVNSADYGYTLVTRQADGSLTMVNYNYRTGAAVNTATVQP